MYRTRRKSVLGSVALSVSVATAPAARAQITDSVQTLWVEVKEAASKRPVPGARVRALADSVVRGQTDSSGLAMVTLRYSARALLVTRIGFRPDTSVVSAEAWAAGMVSVSLFATAQALPEVAVSEANPADNGMMREFHKRRERRAGGASFRGRQLPWP